MRKSKVFLHLRETESLLAACAVRCCVNYTLMLIRVTSLE